MRSTHPEIPRGNLDTNALDLAVAVVAVAGSETMEPWQYLGLLVRDGGGLWCFFFFCGMGRAKLGRELNNSNFLWVDLRTCVGVSRTFLGSILKSSKDSYRHNLFPVTSLKVLEYSF